MGVLSFKNGGSVRRLIMLLLLLLLRMEHGGRAVAELAAAVEDLHDIM